MKPVPFPMNLVPTMTSLRSLFARRGQYKWGHVIFLALFLNGLILIGSSLQYAKLSTYDYQLIVPNGLGAITTETYPALTQGQILEGVYTGQAQSLQDGDKIVEVLPSQDRLSELKASGQQVIALTADRWYFYYPTGQELSLAISGEDVHLADLKTQEDVTKMVNQQWFNQQKFSVVALLTLIQAALLAFGSVVLLGMGGFFLSLTKSSGLFHISSFKEAVGLILNAMLWPSLLTALAAFWVKNPTSLMNIQVIGTVLVLVAIFYKTHFRDETIEQDGGNHD